MNTIAAERDKTVDKRHLIAGVLILGWLTLIMSLGLNGVYTVEFGKPPITLIISFIATYSIFTALYLGFSSVREYLLSIDMRFLIMLNSWRMLGIGFIMLNMFGHLPALFAYVAGIGDAMAAVGAVFLAFNLMKSKEGVAKRVIFNWNTFGLLDFIIAVSIGLLTRTDALLAPANGINSDLMIAFPMVLIPGFLVQLLSLSHIIIFLQLRNNHANDENVKFN